MEFLALDTETNGRAGDLCELTEVGCVLIGGGELHEEWSSLVRVERPLSRGIQRFTGITQAMVDDAPAPDEVLPVIAERLRRRVLVAHNASFDRRVLKQAFERAGIAWPDPPVLCTMAMGRRFAPLARQRRLSLLAESLGIEVGETHRALPDALTCARIFCALFPKLCANAGSLADALRLLGPRRRPSSRGAHPKIPRERRPDLSQLPDDPGVYVFRNEAGQPLYVGKSVAVKSRARAHFCQPGDWTGQAEVVDYIPTNSELGALILENRLIKRWKPTGNRALKRTDRWAYLVCRLDIPFPVLEVAPEPAAGRAVNIGPVRGRAACQELADQLTSLFQLRHCGRKLVIRDHPSLYGQMDRCVSPCLGDLDPNAYRRRLDEALGLFDGADGPERLLARFDEEMEHAAAAQRYERAAVMRDRRNGSRSYSAGSAASCAPSTPARGPCWRNTLSSRRGISSRWLAGAWQTGARSTTGSRRSGPRPSGWLAPARARPSSPPTRCTRSGSCLRGSPATRHGNAISSRARTSPPGSSRS